MLKPIRIPLGVGASNGGGDQGLPAWPEETHSQPVKKNIVRPPSHMHKPTNFGCKQYTFCPDSIVGS